jgi:hypothetical protein
VTVKADSPDRVDKIIGDEGTARDFDVVGAAGDQFI